MFHKRSLSQIKVVELDKYIAYHNVGKYGTKQASWKKLKKISSKNLLNALRERRMGRATISRLLIHSVVNQKTTLRKKTVSLQRLVFRALKRKRSRLKKKK